MELEELITGALAEDIGSGDITTSCTVSPGTLGRGRVVAKEPLVLAGSSVACQVFRQVNDRLELSLPLQDGSPAQKGEFILEVTGDLAAILMAERTALNFLQRLSGIATLTRRFVDRVQGTSTRILDTRKTTPGWRSLEKAAVLAGGGYNHRFGLYDAVLIKDNHIVAAGGLGQAVIAARASLPPTVKVEVEVETLDELAEALDLGVDIVLLDNMDSTTMRAAVRRAAGHIQLEASGGITLENVQEVAATGVDFISVGALTHSAPAVDMSMEIEVI